MKEIRLFWESLFFLPMDKIPTTTAQQKGVKIIRGRPYFYTKREVEDVKNFFKVILKTKRPPQPMTGAVDLVIVYYFKAKKPHKDGQPKVTRPDVDNMTKLILDVMTESGFWNDDSQVFRLTVAKIYSEESGILFEIREKDDKGVVYI